jgi:4-amino-4-deoxy-L-arabinose transferase-like glycosyltransferase
VVNDSIGKAYNVKRSHTYALLVAILLAAFFLRQYKLFGLPFFGDEVDSGDIALEILGGNIAPFYPHAEGREGLYFYTMAIAFALLGDSEIANRWPSVVWSMVFVALMYVYGRVLFRSRRVGLLSAGLAAALFWPTVFAHIGLRPGSMPVIMTPALIGLVLALRAPSDRRALAAGTWGGVFAGLTAYTYTAGRGFPAVVVLFLVYAVVAQRSLLRRRWRALLAYVLLMIVISGWLYIYLRLNPSYDVRLATAQMGLDLLLQGDYGGFLNQVAQTLGMFTMRGEPNPLWNIKGRPVFVGPAGWLFYLGVLLCLRRVRRAEYALQLIVLATMLVPSILTSHPPSWTRSIGMLPALLIVTVLPVEGGFSAMQRWAQVGSRGKQPGPLRRRWALPMYTALVLLLGLSIYVRTASDLFNVWMDHPESYWMAYAFYDETAQYINRSPKSTPLNYVMDWYVPWRKRNLQRAIQRRDVAVRWTVNNALVFPDHPDGLRVAFQVLAAPPLPLLEAFLDPGAPIHVGPRADPEGLHPLHIYHVPRSALDAHLAAARSRAVFPPGSESPVNSPPTVGDWLQFQGYEIANPEAQPGDSLLVFTYWRVLQPPPNITLFVHLLAADDQLVTQYDGFDVVVDDLATGDVVVQLHTLELPPYMPDGLYRLAVGAYTREDLERIPLSTGSDHVVLEPWQLVQNQ